MKRTVSILAFAMVAAFPARAETVFIGNAFIDTVSGSATCTSTFTVGDFGRLIFRPRGAAFGNGGDSQLTYVASRSGFTMFIAGNDFQSGVNFASQSIGSTGTIGSGTGAVTTWTQTPANIGSSQTVKVVGTFTKFFRISPCTVKLRANLVKR